MTGYVRTSKGWRMPSVNIQDLRDRQKALEEARDHEMDSGLIAIALVIRSRDGPRFVYHFPPRPSTKAINRNDVLYGTDVHNGTVDKNSTLSDDSDDSDIEDAQNIALNTRISALNLKPSTDKHDKGKQKAHHVNMDEVEGDEHFDLPTGEHVVPWEYLFEFHTKDLESILTPSKAYHKQKFDLSLDPLHFLSYPIHIRDDGLWEKKKVKKSKKNSKATDAVESSANGTTNDAAESPAPGTASKQATVMNDDTSDNGDDQGGMTMFNVVFILDAGKEGADMRIDQMYENVAKTFNKALNHAQAKSNYVWKESEMILSMKEKAREERRPMSWLWNEIHIKSTLASSIKDVFTSITNNKMATVHFASTPPVDLSLQIPLPTFLTRLPSPLEPGMLGMIVTSANPNINEEGEMDPTYLNKHFALLLLDDESKIIADLQAENTELSGPLIETISLCRSDISFFQVAQTKSIEPDGMLELVQHLIYWRKAIAIPPLHARETYIVSPNCDSRKLPTASIEWKRAFPLAPSLPSFLANLSAAPRPYKTFAPSKDHRPTYLAMLAWLMRNGWVTQLRTFAWILVWPEIIYEVTYKLKAEAQAKAKKASESKINKDSDASTDDSSSGNDTENGVDNDPDVPMSTEQAAENARLKRLAQKLEKEAADEAAAFAAMPVPVVTETPSTNYAEHLHKIEPCIIVDPRKASNEESLYIKAIEARITDKKAKKHWPNFVKYFNGEEALEMIALQENLKRKETMTILMWYQEHLLLCKHW